MGTGLLFLLFLVASAGSTMFKTCLDVKCPDGCKCIDTSITYIPRPRCVPRDCDYRGCDRECPGHNNTSIMG